MAADPVRGLGCLGGAAPDDSGVALAMLPLELLADEVVDLIRSGIGRADRDDVLPERHLVRRILAALGAQLPPGVVLLADVWVLRFQLCKACHVGLPPFQVPGDAATGAPHGVGALCGPLGPAGSAAGRPAIAKTLDLLAHAAQARGEDGRGWTARPHLPIHRFSVRVPSSATGASLWCGRRATTAPFLPWDRLTTPSNPRPE